MIGFKASDRDKDRAVRLLSELRELLTGEVLDAGRELRSIVGEAYQLHDQRIARASQQLDQIEGLATTILRQGSNLAPNLSGQERRKTVDGARIQVDKLLTQFEEARAKRNEAAMKARAERQAEAALVATKGVARPNLVVERADGLSYANDQAECAAEVAKSQAGSDGPAAEPPAVDTEETAVMP